jgi:hypothetical protein
LKIPFPILRGAHQVETLARYQTGLVGIYREKDHPKAAIWLLEQQLGTLVPAALQLLGRLAINPK